MLVLVGDPAAPYALAPMLYLVITCDTKSYLTLMARLRAKFRSV